VSFWLFAAPIYLTRTRGFRRGFSLAMAHVIGVVCVNLARFYATLYAVYGPDVFMSSRFLSATERLISSRYGLLRVDTIRYRFDGSSHRRIQYSYSIALVPRSGKNTTSQGVEVVVVNSNLADNAQAVATHVKDFSVGFPVLVDERQVVADIFGARRTPEAFVLDRRRHIQYPRLARCRIRCSMMPQLAVTSRPTISRKPEFSRKRSLAALH
jgi:hypothetical protein